MIRSFVFSQGRLLSQDVTGDVLRMMLFESEAHVWVDLEAPTEQETKSLLQDTFNFHPLAIEDCVMVSERPKVDNYDEYIFMAIHSPDFSDRKFNTTELNLFIGKNFLVTYHCEPMKCITATIDRISRNAPMIARAPDRLTYTILDLLLENYDPATASLSSEIEHIEKKVLESPSVHVLDDVLYLKDQVQSLRQILTPQRDVIGRIAHGEFKIVRSHMLPYYRDLLDQIVRTSDHADNYRDSLTGILQVHLNLQQMQVNKVIKVLTVLATLSMPMLIITSYYGMNINHFPSFDWPVGFAYIWIFGLASFITGLVYMLLRRKNLT